MTPGYYYVQSITRVFEDPNLEKRYVSIPEGNMLKIVEVNHAFNGTQIAKVCINKDDHCFGYCEVLPYNLVKLVFFFL